MSKRIPKKINKINPKSSNGMFCVIENDFNKKGSQAVFLYRFVYSNIFSYLACFILLISFLFQGVDFAYADENITDTQEIGYESDTDNNLVPDQELMLPSEVAQDDLEDPSINQESQDEQLDSIETTEIDDVSNLDTNTENLDVEIFEEESVGTDGVDSISGDNAEVASTSTSEVVEEEQEELEEQEDIILTEDDLAASTTETISTVQSDSAFSFTKNECTQLANGSFYCIKPQENVLKDALFSAPDEQGDLEIFFVRDGSQMQVTDNTEDDASPFYDQNTNSIVWHRLLNDRYQIVLYDIDSGTEKILTNTNSNNMEPNKQGDYIVWQRWVDGAWNIVLFDGKEESQITTSSGNNVAPYIHGSLVVWNRHSSDGVKTIEIYNIESRTYVTVDDPDGLSVSNPRMVFVYDSLAPNGDIVTKGYDLLAKKFIELDSLPIELPDEIPSSDSTGETRALIQSKPTSKSELEELVNATSTNMSSGNNSTSTSTVSVSATTTQDVQIVSGSDLMTLDLSTSTVVNVEETETAVESAYFDVVIEPYTSDQSESIVEFIEPVQE